MILVTGTKRSGTSMWMQVLVASELPYIGEPYMGAWEDSIKAANPNGFYESPLRQGIFYGTNPHPQTGAFLFPRQTRTHVVKVFVPGLVRTDYAYIDHVVATMRSWREYGRSLHRLYELEDAWFASHEPDKAAELQAKAARSRSKLPPAVEWWFENYDLIRDIATRRYKVNLTSYDRMLRDPEPVVRQVFAWLGAGDADKALQAIEPKLRSQRQQDDGDLGVSAEHAAVMDELYHTVDQGQALSGGLLQKLNTVQEQMAEEHGRLSRERSREDEPAPGG